LTVEPPIGSVVSVRYSPGGMIIGRLTRGAAVEILEPPLTVKDEVWYHILSIEDRLEGWIPAAALEPKVAGTAASSPHPDVADTEVNSKPTNVCTTACASVEPVQDCTGNRDYLHPGRGHFPPVKRPHRARRGPVRSIRGRARTAGLSSSDSALQ
jgi:hypothetical protein